MFGTTIAKMITGRINQKHYATPVTRKPQGAATLKIAGQTKSSEETTRKSKRLAMADWFLQLGEYYLNQSDSDRKNEADWMQMANLASEWSTAMMTSTNSEFDKYHSNVMTALRNGELVY